MARYVSYLSQQHHVSKIHSQSNEFIRDIWAPRRLLRAGGLNRELAFKVAEKDDDLAVFGRYFISNVSAVSLYHSSYELV